MRIIKKAAATVLAVLCVLCLTIISPISASASFDDVATDAWYTRAVTYVTSHGYFAGVDGNRFAPSATMTRAMFVTVLRALSGDNSEYEALQFTDVPSNAWYARSVGWAADHGIVSGTAENSFSPDSNVTRQQVCLILQKYLKYIKLTCRPVSLNTQFTDDGSIAQWASEAVYKMRDMGIVGGKGDGIFAPTDGATRAEIAQMIMKFDEEVLKYKGDGSIYPTVTEIQLDGLREDFVLVNLSDTHISESSDSDSDAIRAYTQQRKAQFSLINGDGIDIDIRFPHFLQYAESRADLLTMTGDIIDSPSEGNLSYLSDKLGSYNKDFVYVAGNHDWSFPDGVEDYSYHSAVQEGMFIPRLNMLLPNENDTAQLSVRDYENFSVIAIDNSRGTVNLSSYRTLKQYCDAGKPVLLMLHVPVYSPGFVSTMTDIWGSDISMGYSSTSDPVTRNLLDLLYSSDSTVFAILSGHVHFGYTGDISENNDTIQYITSSGNYGAFSTFVITDKNN